MSRSLIAALALLPACVHSVPIRLGPGDALEVGGDGPVPAQIAPGERVPVSADWSLVVDRAGRRDVVDGPLALVHRDGVLMVEPSAQGGDAPALAPTTGSAVAYRFPDREVRAAAFERPNVGGTVALAVALTVLVGAGTWGWMQLLTVGEQ